MKIGFIGEVLVRKIKAAGHQVKIAHSRGPAFLQTLADEIGVDAVSVEEAVEDVDIVFVVIPQKSVLDLPKDLLANRGKALKANCILTPFHW
jgi:predicted dinucleotide-binding enzyme